MGYIQKFSFGHAEIDFTLNFNSQFQNSNSNAWYYAVDYYDHQYDPGLLATRYYYSNSSKLIGVFPKKIINKIHFVEVVIDGNDYVKIAGLNFNLNLPNNTDVIISVYTASKDSNGNWYGREHKWSGTYPVSGYSSSIQMDWGFSNEVNYIVEIRLRNFTDNYGYIPLNLLGFYFNNVSGYFFIDRVKTDTETTADLPSFYHRSSDHYFYPFGGSGNPDNSYWNTN